MERLLILNPGSTSTKLAVFDGEEPLFVESITHSAEELAPFDCVADQYEFRRELVLDCLKRHDVSLDSLTAIVSRGGLLTPIEAGAYEVNDDMVWQLKNKPQNEHASNVGAMIARSISLQLGIPTYIYDGVTVDELLPINKLTGLPSMRRKGMGHNLNTRAAALRYARESGRDYKDITVIVAHLGGGISVNLHHNGKIEDFISDEEGPFSPERAGGLPMFDVIKECFSGRYDYKGMMKLVKNQGGLMAHLGTTDSRAVEQMIQSGDAHAKLVYDAMILNIAKNIAKCAPNVCGKVDAILLTGGIAYSQYVTSEIEKRVSFLAPVVVYPGEDEMRSLALGGLRVLRGQETAKIFHKSESANGENDSDCFNSGAGCRTIGIRLHFSKNISSHLYQPSGRGRRERSAGFQLPFSFVLYYDQKDTWDKRRRDSVENFDYRGRTAAGRLHRRGAAAEGL